MTARKAPEDKLKTGRPTIYNEEIAEEICDKIGTGTKSIETLCNENPHWPCQDTVFRWRKKYPKFSEDYALAKMLQVEPLIDKMLHISFDDSQDRMPSDKGCWVSNTARVQRAKVISDNIKWVACKLVPKLYGDRMHTESAVTLEGSLQDLK